MSTFLYSRPISPRHLLAVSLVAAAGGILACDSSVSDEPLSPSAESGRATAQANALATATVFATGLKFPRGFTFGADGFLYVAEAGFGGTTATKPARCDQVAPPVGPYGSARTARISKVSPKGFRTTVATSFPSAVNSFGDVVGVADVAFLDGQLYALVAGGGCSHGVAGVPAGIAHVSSSGAWTIVADLSAFQAAHPVAQPFAGDFEPDGTWYSMLAVGGKLFAVEPNHGELVRVQPGTWRVSRVVDVSATQGHIVPTALAQRNGALYLSHLGTFPVTSGAEKVFYVARDGALTVKADGFTTVLGLDFDAKGRMYALETTAGGGFPTPGTGRVVRLNGNGTRDVIVDELFFPTAMRFGPDGLLYISNKGFGPPQLGEILRVKVPG